MTTKIFDSFAGLDNKNRPESLVANTTTGGATKSAFLTVAKNVDISDTFAVSRRDGFSQSVEGSFHSLWSNPAGTVTLCVKDSRLVLVNPISLDVTDLGAASDRPVSYADTGAGVYLSDGQTLWVYAAGVLNIVAHAGTYEWPDRNTITPEDREGFYDSPPPGSIVAWMYGRLWVVTEDAIFYSKAFEPHLFDLVNDYLDIQNVTMLGGVTGGFYIGTATEVYYYSSQNPKSGGAFALVSDAGAVSRAYGTFPAAMFSDAGDVGDVLIWESPARGKFLGAAGGTVRELTSDHVAYDAGSQGALFLRESDGQAHIVSTLSGQSGEISNMRASDSAEAEIWRNGSLI